MAKQTFTSNGSISISALGRIKVTGSLTWTPPTLPEGATEWESITVSGYYTWGGKGKFTLNINGTSVSPGSSFNIALPTTVTSPFTITGTGSNLNTLDANCNFTDLILTYVCRVPGKSQVLINVNGNFESYAFAYKVVNGQIVEQEDFDTLFDENVKYITK